MAVIEPMMKRGKATFTWKDLRSTAQPSIADAVGASQDATELEIPLKFIIPHFMAASKPASEQKQVDVDTSIPDVFSKEDIEAKTQAAAPAPPKEEASPAPTAPEPAPSPSAAPSATAPNEIVERLSQIPGVTGALITMGDGLSMAKKLPAGVDSDALAGFVPGLYNRTAQ